MVDKLPKYHEVTVKKLVHGGQALGTLPDGRKIFVWNALPGERVVVAIGKAKRNFLEGIATEIMQPSSERVEPRDEAYLSTSPWQIMTLEAETKYKQEIIAETFQREHVNYHGEIAFNGATSLHDAFHYRNKMEYSFWGDEDGLHLALFHRASHGKRIITGSSLAIPEIDEAARKVRDILSTNGTRAGDLKTVVLRVNQAGETVVALFVRREDFEEIPELSRVCKGLVVYFSNPKSPASVITRELYRYGDITLSDTLLGRKIAYDVNSFFQVNQSVFSQALRVIKDFTKNATHCVDMYSGVGTIGLCLGGAVLVESDHHNCEMARQNNSDKKCEVIEAPAEKALSYIVSSHTLIVDPPRAGLHKDVIARILEVKPPQIAYLSCNPITQARDLALLQDVYDIQSVEGYNFFPRTPHIESLALLQLKQEKA